MIRFFKELFNRPLKCERVGHLPNIEERSGIRKNTETRVARWRYESVRQRRHVCRRCKTVLSEWEDYNYNYLSSLTMPTSDWDELDVHGEVWHSVRVVGVASTYHGNDEQMRANNYIAAGDSFSGGGNSGDF